LIQQCKSLETQLSELKFNVSVEAELLEAVIVPQEIENSN
jgi:hypothetical protein